VQLIGNKAFAYPKTATQYPELLFIQDMLEMRENRWVEISSEEYEGIRDRVGIG
jgi:hypothetical protein